MVQVLVVQGKAGAVFDVEIIVAGAQFIVERPLLACRSEPREEVGRHVRGMRSSLCLVERCLLGGHDSMTGAEAVGGLFTLSFLWMGEDRKNDASGGAVAYMAVRAGGREVASSSKVQQQVCRPLVVCGPTAAWVRWALGVLSQGRQIRGDGFAHHCLGTVPGKQVTAAVPSCPWGLMTPAPGMVGGQRRPMPTTPHPARWNLGAQASLTHAAPLTAGHQIGGVGGGQHSFVRPACPLHLVLYPAQPGRPSISTLMLRLPYVGI